MPTQNRADTFSPAPGQQRIPPQDLGAEVCVLGSMILDKDGIGEIIPILRAEHFYRQDHRLIYDALIRLYENNKPIDLVLLQDELDAQSQLEPAGGAQYLVDLVNGVPSAANMVYYARIVRDKGMLRNLITTSSEINNMAYEARGDVGEVRGRRENDAV